MPSLPPSYLHFNWAFASGIINMQLQSPLGECRRGPCLFVLSGRTSVAHYSFVRPRWVVAIQPLLCTEREAGGPGGRGRQEAHPQRRSQIIHLVLRREGSTEHRRAKLKENEKERRGVWKWWWGVKIKQTTARWCCELKMKRRKRWWGWTEEWRGRWSGQGRERERSCAFLIRAAVFTAWSFTMCGGAFSAPLMTIANLCKDMDYVGAKLATKHPIILILLPAWPHFWKTALIRPETGFNPDLHEDNFCTFILKIFFIKYAYGPISFKHRCKKKSVETKKEKNAGSGVKMAIDCKSASIWS